MKQAIESATLESIPEAGRPAHHGRPAPSVLRIAGLLVAAAALLPAAYLLVRALERGLAPVLSALVDPRTFFLLARTGLLAATVSLGAVLIAVPVAWITVRTDLPGRRIWVVATALPLVIPSYVGGYAFVAALGPRGLLQSWLEPLGVQRLPEIYGFGGAWLVLTLFTYPYVLLTVRSAIRGLDPSLEDASRGLGRSQRATFWKVVLPQLRPSIAAGSLLVALYALSDFGAVSLLRFDSFTRVIYQQYQASFDRTPAAVLSLALVALTAIVLTAEIRSRGRAAYHGATGTRSLHPPRSTLGRWRWPAAAACGALTLVALIVPVGIVCYWMARGLMAGERVGFTFAGAVNSLQISAIGAAAALVVAWPVAVLSARHPGRFAFLVERASYVGYALPGIVVALSLVFFGARLVPALYQTRAMLAFAYVVLFLPQAVGALRSSLLQVSPHLEEAARSLGSSRYEVLWRVTLPLVRPGAVAAYALVFLTAMKELPATLLLAPTGFPTLATQVWNATSEAFFARAAAPALGIVLLSSLPLAVLVFREGDAHS